jgi:hypothetical protein
MTKHIISFSGGMGSFAEAKSCVDKFGKENVLILFADVLMEDADLYRFVDECVSFLDCEFVRVSLEKTPWDLFKEIRFIGNTIVDRCSSDLKRDLLIGWIDEKYGIDLEVPLYNIDGTVRLNIYGEVLTHKVRSLSDAEVHLGIDFSEHHRLSRLQKYMYPKVYRSTLVEDGRIVPKDFSEQFGIRKPFLYTLGFAHNNCGGFCVKAGLGQFKKLYEELPERYTWHEQQEQETLALGAKPFLRITRNGKKRYITMKEYKEEFLEQNKADEFKYDLGGCGCALPS